MILSYHSKENIKTWAANDNRPDRRRKPRVEDLTAKNFMRILSSITHITALHTPHQYGLPQITLK